MEKETAPQVFSFLFFFRVKQIQNELGTQILADFEDALSVKGLKVTFVSRF